MRKFLSQKFWSHGTSLGSLGPLSQGDVHPGFSRPQFLVIWDQYNYPGIVACHEQAKNLKLTYSLVCPGKKTTSFPLRGPNMNMITTPPLSKIPINDDML